MVYYYLSNSKQGNYEVQGNDGYLYLFIDEQTPYIWKKVQIGVKAVGNILQSTQCMMGVLYGFNLR